MKRLSIAVSAGLVAGLVGLSAQTPASKSDLAMNDKTITVTGCIAAGTEPSSYTLTGAKMSGNLASTTTAGTGGIKNVEKSASMEHGATYQLKGGDLKAHVGHQVELTGTTNAGKPTDKTADVGTAGTTKDTPLTLTVKSVKMVSTTCS